MAERTRDPRTGRYLNPGGFSTPPPNAPHERSQPVNLSEQDVASAHARAEARAAERLAHAEGGGRAEGQTSLSLSPDPHADTDADARGNGQPEPEPQRNGQPALSEGQARAGRSGVDPVLPPPEILGRPSVPEPEPIPSALDDLTEAFRATHPAASRTDSPSRGIPTPSTDPGKQVTGGWGPTGSGSEYFALNGDELKQIAIALAGRLKQALEGDLRFGLSVVYPQVRISLHLTVDGRTPEGRDLDLRDRDNTRVELDFSRILDLAADVEDSADTPAGKIRDDFQIRGPRKQVIRAGAARLLVDVPNEL